MEALSRYFLFPMFLAFAGSSLFLLQVQANGGIKLGAILDCNSRIGKEEKVAMEIALQDFYKETNQSLALQVINSNGEPTQAAFAAAHLIHEQRVEAILGTRTWEEASVVAEISSKSQTPILCFADSPSWATAKWPFLVQASPSQHAQAKALAAIVASWGWRKIVLIYEDIASEANKIIPHLSQSLQEKGAEISDFVPLPPFASSSSSLSKELDKLKRGQCRVFVVHTSLTLAIRLFETAKKMEMMEKEYAWITTETVTNLVHTINSSTIARTMQGLIGVKTYFPESGSGFHNFYALFTRKFGSNYPEERNHEPGIFALQAYDATKAVALAITTQGFKKGKDLLGKILLSNFDGLGGKFMFNNHKLAPSPTFEIISVIGKSYRELGFWRNGFGFSRIMDENATSYNESMLSLRQVFWPGEARSTPKGWTLPTNAKRLRIGVPRNGTLFNLFLTVEYDELTKNYSINGFSVDLFKETIEHLPYYVPYDLIPFDGTFDDLVYQVYIKEFDGALGGIAITAKRYERVDFSHPHTDGGLVMVVPVQTQLNNKAWLFLKPFTKAMWVLTAFINVYNGFVVWMIERDHYSDLRGSALNQIGTLLWLAFSTLFSSHAREKLHSNLSRMATVVWLFVALVIIQSYTANLTSMLTVPRLEPTVADIETLKYNNAMVGSTAKSFVSNYLTDVLKFSPDKLKKYSTPEEIARGFRNKEIEAALIEVPWAKLFLAKYCKSFVTAGPVYKIGGYGFVFPKGSPMLSDVNEALTRVIESGKLRELENRVTPTESCVDVESEDKVSLSPSSFWALFVLSGGTSSIALVTYVILGKFYDKFSVCEQKDNWVLLFVGFKSWYGQQKWRFSGRVVDIQSSKSDPRV